jgi:hypothetical protein
MDEQVMADLWADFNKASREASMLRMEPQGYAPWVAARKAIVDEVERPWREAAARLIRKIDADDAAYRNVSTSIFIAAEPLRSLLNQQGNDRG